MKDATTRNSLATAIGLFLLLLAATPAALAQTTTTFTHQGRLTDSGAAANGAYDLQFALFDALSGGAQQGATLTRDDVPVTNGVFTVALDFGATPFSGAARWLQISVRAGASTGAYTTLTPRQPLSAAPYAIRSQAAATADALSANCVGCITAAQIQNGGSFIQNATTPQADANFNISGNGTAGGTLSAATVSGDTVNAVSQFNLNGARFLYGTGNSNIFAGGGAGATNAGGAFNSFFGVRAGLNNLTGSGNVFLGNDTGLNNSSGNSNTLIGSGASVAADGLSFATAIGSLATVSASNTIAIGRTVDTALLPPATRIGAVPLGAAGSTLTLGGADDTVTVPGTFSLPGTLSLGSVSAQTQYNLNGLRVLHNGGASSNIFVGIGAGLSNNGGVDNAFLGRNAGAANVLGFNNTIIGAGANVGSPNLQFATAIGAGAVVNTDHTVMLGRSDGTVRVPGLLLVGNTLLASGVIRVSFLGTAGSTQVCRNANNELATCSSSLRYKTGLAPYRHGLDFIQRLQPISFTWKEGGLRDLGFGAEDVAKVDPLLVIHNAKGEVEGVKYDRLSALLVNAVKEQQACIEALQQEVATLKAGQAENATLKTQLAAILARQAQQEAQLTALAAQSAQPKAADQR